MILSTEQIKILKENKELITSEILDELRKTKEGKSVALEILDIERDNEDYYLDAFGGRISFNGNRQIKPFHTKINLSDIHIQEIKRCSEDVDYFKNNYVQFRTKSGIGFPDHREYQEKFIHSLNNTNEQYLVVFPRQAGKSATTAVWLTWLFLFKEQINIGICANRGSTATDFLANVKNIYTCLPIWLQQGIKVWNVKRIEGENGTRILTDATSGDSFRGSTMNVVIVDECIEYNSIITLKNKTTGEIKDIKIGDFYNLQEQKFDNSMNFQVLTSNGFKDFDGIKKTVRDDNIKIYFGDDFLITTPEHKYYTGKDFVYAEDIKINDIIFGKQVTKIEKNVKCANVFFDLINVSDGHHFTANSIEVSNCAYVAGTKWESFVDSVLPSQSSLAWKKTIFISTPNGLNHFYSMVKDSKKRKVIENLQESEIEEIKKKETVLDIVKNKYGTFDVQIDKPSNDMELITVDWREVPRYDRKGNLIDPETFKQQVIDRQGLQYFLQAYACEFLGSSHTLISGDVLKDIESVKPKDRIFVQGTEEFVKIYEEPLENHKYILSVDPAKDGRDYFALHMIDLTKFPFKQVASGRLQIDYLLMPNFLYEFGISYNTAFTIIENNEGAGQSIADTLKRDFEYENLYYDRSGNKFKTYPGFRTTPKSRAQLLETLKLLIENKKLEICDSDTILELQRFILVKKKFQAEEGFHDDLVMSLAIAFCLFNDIQNFEDFKEVTKSIYSESDTDFADYITIGNFDDGNPETEFDEMTNDYFYGI